MPLKVSKGGHCAVWNTLSSSNIYLVKTTWLQTHYQGILLHSLPLNVVKMISNTCTMVFCLWNNIMKVDWLKSTNFFNALGIKNTLPKSSNKPKSNTSKWQAIPENWWTNCSGTSFGWSTWNLIYDKWMTWTLWHSSDLDPFVLSLLVA